MSLRSLRPRPTLTCWQSAALTEPTTVLYDPAAQLVQAVTPVVPLYLPATHSVHAAALVAAGVALALPASHSWQSPALTEPTTVLYDPAAQSTHRVAPMAALAYVPLGHSVHAAALVAAGVALTLPASHCDEEVG